MSSTILIPVSFAPPTVAKSFPQGSKVTPSIFHLAGQSTLHGSFPTPPSLISTSPSYPQSHWYSIIGYSYSIGFARVILLHFLHRILKGSQSFGSFLLDIFSNIFLILSVFSKAIRIASLYSPFLYISLAR